MDDILTPTEVAQLLKVSEKTLRKWRKQGYGPRWFKLGQARTSSVRYRREAVNAYLDRVAAP